MTKSKQMSNNDQPTAVVQPEKRAWVTPAFEQVPLKEALSGSGPISADLGTSSS